MALDRTYFNTLTDETSPGLGTPVDKAMIDAIYDDVDAILGAIDDEGAISYAASTELTIASGAVTLGAGKNVHSVDTQADAASDDLDTITLDPNGRACRLLILKPENAARVVTVKHNTGNIHLKGGDFAMSDADHRLLIVRDGATWYELARNAGGTGSPGGSDTQVQFNDSSAFGGDAGLTYNKTTDALTAGSVVLTAGQAKFPSTQNPSSDPNTLDDYEEQSWTPVIGGTTSESGQAYSIQVGRAIKVGKQVTLTFTVQLSTKGTITGAVVIKGIPYAIITLTNYDAVGVVQWGQLNTNWTVVAMIGLSGGSYLSLQGAAAAGTSSLAASLATTDLTNTSIFRGSISYVTDN